MSEPALALTGVTKSYGSGRAAVHVLRGVDLAIRPGEIVALAAPSGAGKSTLLHVAGLLDQADSGEIRIGGALMTGLADAGRTAARRAEIGFVYQFHHLLPEFTAEENVILPQLAAGTPRAAALDRARALLAAVGLSGRAGHRPAALSGGERQRAAICRALANRPRLLLADEPTGNLDVETSANVFDLLLGIARDEGLAALIATHNPDLAARMDRTIRLEAGRLK
ncbi:ABC transporter ATP-binding protein [Pikeienuella sp. HZG-20]|uniref:ABC transporter ATP-binding protein n=1 Tax=Paludibacillus litoralis TaxID=3133267 RepID=UPI0030ECB51C